jgi:hypothetical protein
MKTTEGKVYLGRSACIAAARRQLGDQAEIGKHFTLDRIDGFAYCWWRAERKGQSTVPMRRADPDAKFFSKARA